MSPRQSKVHHNWFAFAGSLALIAGCANIIGADEYKVASDASVDAAGAMGGAAGSGAFSDGSGGSLGDSSASGGAAGVTPRPEGGAGDVFVHPDAAPFDHGDIPLPANAGETYCTNSCATSGLACLQSAFGTKGICTYSCGSDDDCDPTHTCVGSRDATDQFPYSCLKRCTNGTCPGGFFCSPIDPYPACLPNDWYKGGLGDDCTSDAECTSGFCLNAPSGWCSKACTSGDTCEHNAAGYENVYNEFNWCYGDQTTNFCVPGCDDPSVCSHYPGTTCQMLTDIDGLEEPLCLPPL